VKASDLLVDEFPHGTVEGYERGCHGGICPAPIACVKVWMRYRSDMTFRRQIDAGFTLEQIIAAEVAAAEADILAEKEARRPWSADDDDAIRAGHASDLTVSAIAEQIGRGRQLVKDHAEALGLRFRDGRAGRSIPQSDTEQGESVSESQDSAPVAVSPEPKRRRHIGPVPDHGTTARFQRGCKEETACPNFGSDRPTCREASRLYMREYMRRRAAS
jgi:hypothetical protein